MTEPEALPETLRWLAQYTGFPTNRLAPAAETMVLVAGFAAAEEAQAAQRFAVERRKSGDAAALRAHTLRRAQVHYKCDNSTKV